MSEAATVRHEFSHRVTYALTPEAGYTVSQVLELIRTSRVWDEPDRKTGDINVMMCHPPPEEGSWRVAVKKVLDEKTTSTWEEVV